jgi:DNA ligase (NAD+)
MREVYRPRRLFHKLNEEKLKAGENDYDNPGNPTAGSLKLLDPFVFLR